MGGMRKNKRCQKMAVNFVCLVTGPTCQPFTTGKSCLYTQNNRQNLRQTIQKPILCHKPSKDQIILCPVVQSIVNLTSLLMTNYLAVVAKVFSNTLIFLLLTFFSAKNINVLSIVQDKNFNITQTNNFV